MFGLQAQIQYIRNDAFRQNAEALLRSKDFRHRRSYETQYACCDAYHLVNQPDRIRCCVLGQSTIIK